MKKLLMNKNSDFIYLHRLGWIIHNSPTGNATFRCVSLDYIKSVIKTNKIFTVYDSNHAFNSGEYGIKFTNSTIYITLPLIELNSFSVEDFTNYLLNNRVKLYIQYNEEYLNEVI